MNAILKERREQVLIAGNGQPAAMACEKPSAAGSVSQRACVFCGSRVVLYPISDALHLVHGPIGCAAYTWDIRGSLSSGRQLHRMSFCTDMRENEIIHGGEKKLYNALCELITRYKPNGAFVYATCIAGLIGDDIDAVCKRVAHEFAISVLPVHSEGFKGSKKDGYRAACDALDTLIGSGPTGDVSPFSINILGDFNLAGETWMIREYYRRMGVEVVSVCTGDGRIEEIKRAHGARLNVVQCSGSMKHLAKRMRERFGIPSIQVSYFGIEDTAKALYDVADFFKNPNISRRTQELVAAETKAVMSRIKEIRTQTQGKRAAIYVGGAFKAFSLVKALRMLGMKTAVVGSQTGTPEDYDVLKSICDPGTIIVDDSNPRELASFIIEKNVDLFIGGVKERPMAYKLGIGFVDHNHERKIALAGFKGMLNFCEEVAATVLSPVWNLVPRRKGKTDEPPSP
jgi:nitrogenase molybdenum-cofactor synthesis protein NifE